MEYLALYRKYRPSVLEEMVGQKEIRKIIASSINNGTISHAYLFSGPRGTGKTTTAKIMAKMVNCENLVNDMPCGKCDSCLSVDNGNDIIEIDAASNNGVDEIRELREKANLVPSVCKYKVYIIDEVHMLTTQAFNALLKTLEEPPKHVIFILATTEYYKIPLTITSRCQKFQFNKIDDNDIVIKLREIANLENIEISDDALFEIAKLSDGGMRDSINFLDQLRSFKNSKIEIDDVYNVCGNVSVDEISKLLLNIKKGDFASITCFLEELNNNGKNYNKFLEEVMNFLKDLILYKKDVSSNLIKTDVNYFMNVDKEYSMSDIFYVVDEINKLIDKIKFVSRQQIVVVTNFLLISNKFNSDFNKKEVVNKIDNSGNDNIEKLNFNKKINFTSNKVDNSDNLLVDIGNVEDDNSNNNNVNMRFFEENRDIIINNAFALADKKMKFDLQSKWSKVNDYLTDSYFSSIAGKWVDANIEVVGGNYIIFTVMYDSLIDSIYSSGKLSNEFLEIILGNSYYYVVISNNDWNKYKNDYINNIKNGNKYVLKEIINLDNKNDNVKNNETIVDRLFSIIGEENIEFK